MNTGTNRYVQAPAMERHYVDSQAKLGASSDFESCVRMLYNTTGSRGSIKLRLRSLADERCLRVDPIKTVLETKELYERVTGIPSSQLDFIYMGKIMENALCLLEGKVSSRSIVHVVFKNFSIFIGTREHKFYCMKVNAQTDVSAIKARVYENAGIEVKQQRLVYKGKELEDQYNLAYYRATKPNGVFHLIVRGAGGRAGDSLGRGMSDDVTTKAVAANQEQADMARKHSTEYCRIV